MSSVQNVDRLGHYENRNVPVRDLWDGFNPKGFDGGMFVILRGYIDESYSNERIPKMFGLACTMAEGKEWPWIEMAWQKCIEEKNASLGKQGRKTISRYHSADINNFVEEFEDWDGPERLEFCEKLMKVFYRHTVGCEAIVVNVQELIEVWPETASNPLPLAYDILLTFLMIEMGASFNEEIPGSKITIFHERCPYDSVYLESFNRLVKDQTFSYRNYFTTIAPMGWEDCIPLQPADLLAYETFKEGLRHLPAEKPRQRRKIFQEIISSQSIGHLKQLDRDTMLGLKRTFDANKNKRL